MLCHKWIEHLLLCWRVFYCAKGSLWWFLVDIFDACESERVVFQDLHVRIPFDDFTMGVLRILNEALTQLHPNGWTTMRAFRALFLYSSVPTMPRLYYFIFLHYFCNHPQDKAQWISLIRILKCPLFYPFTSLYKNLKTGYFKVIIRPVIGKNFFSDSAGNPLFPFYWQQCPRRYDKYPKKLLRANEWWDLEFLETLPWQLPAWPLVSLL